MYQLGSMARIAVTLFATLVFAAWLPAACQGQSPLPEPAPRYLILDTARPKTLQKELDHAAGAGFRVVAGSGRTLILEKAANGMKHEYLIADSVKSMVKKGKINGYRVLPSTFARGGAMLEKLQEGESQPEYQVLDLFLEKDLNEWSGRGFRLVALSAYQVENSAYRYGLMERLGGSPASGPTDWYVVLETNRTDPMEKKIEETVARGYRVLAAIGPIAMSVILEKVAADDPKPEYRVLAASFEIGRLEQEITAAASDGYRLLPMTLCTRGKAFGLLGRFGNQHAVIVEKSPPGAIAPQYKMLDTWHKSTLQLQDELNEATSAGWSVSRLFEETMREEIVVLEKAAKSVEDHPAKP
jgi:hypothetical protein